MATRWNQSELRKVERREWWLWATAFTVTLLLTAAIVSFLPFLLRAQESWETRFGVRLAVWGFLGAVLLSDLYSIHQQQLQIQRMSPAVGGAGGTVSPDQRERRGRDRRGGPARPSNLQ